jgi:hypothetical protein
MINLQNNIDLSFVVVVLHHIVVIMVQYNIDLSFVVVVLHHIVVIMVQYNIDLSFVVVVLHHIVVIMVQYFYVVIVFIREYKLYLLQHHTSEFDAKLPA